MNVLYAGSRTGGLDGEYARYGGAAAAAADVDVGGSEKEEGYVI